MDNNTEPGEARHQRQPDATSDALDREVNAEIAARAERREMALANDAAEAERVATQAGKLDRLELDRREAAAATASAEAAASARARNRVLERDRLVSGISRVVTYLFSLVYGLLLIRVVLALLGASATTPFVGLIHTMARPFHAPFDGIAATLTTSPIARVVVPMLVAIFVGALVHAAIIGLLRLFAPRETVEA